MLRVLDRANAPLAPLTTLRLGGPARRLVTVHTEAELLDIVGRADAAGEPLLVLGGGSNVVLPDAGFDGTVVRVAVHGLAAERAGDCVLLTVAAGEDWDALVALTVADGLAGLEALSGIPGLVGAGPVQNIGAYGQELAQTVRTVRVLDRPTGQVHELTREQCAFGYRHSRFKAEPHRALVLSVTFALEPGGLSAPVGYAELAGALGVQVGARAPLQQVRDGVLRLRRGKGMVLDDDDPDTRSAGSFFTNPLLDSVQAAGLDPAAPRWPAAHGRVKTSAAWLIEHAGFGKGHFDGPVGLSSKHTLALVHRGGGSTAQLLHVARQVRDGVRSAYNIELQAEPVLVGTEL